MFVRFSLFVALTFCSLMHARVLVFTYAYNRPDFIEIQHRTLQKFMRDDYELIVFSDAREEPHISSIEATCARLGIRFIAIPQEIHNQPYLARYKGEDYNAPAVRNANAVQYSLNLMGYAHDDIVMLLDSDLFLVKPFSIREYLEGYGLAGLRQGREHIEYLWIGLAFLDMRNLPKKASISFNCGIVDGVPVDAGGFTHYYLKHNPEVRMRSIGYFTTDVLRGRCEDEAMNCAQLDQWLALEGFDQHQITFLQGARDLEFFGNKEFLHYRGGTNWNYRDPDYHRKKTDALNAYIDTIAPKPSRSE